jgi:hypothetical protein
MTYPTLVFTGEREGRPELVVNFGVFSGREATEAEIYRLAQRLLEGLGSIEIISERRYEVEPRGGGDGPSGARGASAQCGRPRR